MSAHQFDTEIAQQVGVNAAVIFQHIVFWCEKNAANGSNLREGRYWTYNSMAAFQELFPYLTFSQIRTALAKLEEVGLILSGEFNEDRWLRRKWYCVASLYAFATNRSSICEKSQMHLSPVADAFAENRSSYKDTDNRTQIENTDKAPIAQGADLFKAEETPKQRKEDRGFDEFWKIYPKKAGKPAALKAWRAAMKRGVDPDEILAGARDYAGSEAVARGFVKFPQGWLNDERWRDEPTSGPSITQTFDKPTGGHRLRPAYGEVVR